ncbi:hypothetical protein L6452_41987 [Arctium lappa]|uniref:Uncharacterized protein n=1 Tax=Arctium lappa TaxID=4217 RepID=A0ACB8XL33_ARCLA|nr:hypothetical protein L6452_41987 [Arctium lappa]
MENLYAMNEFFVNDVVASDNVSALELPSVVVDEPPSVFSVLNSENNKMHVDNETPTGFSAVNVDKEKSVCNGLPESCDEDVFCQISICFTTPWPHPSSYSPCRSEPPFSSFNRRNTQHLFSLSSAQPKHTLKYTAIHTPASTFSLSPALSFYRLLHFFDYCRNMAY